MTPDGNFAVVRSTTPAAASNNPDTLSAWDLIQRTRLNLTFVGQPGGPSPGRGEFLPGSEVSDLVETTNVLALCAGSGTILLGPNAGFPGTFVDVIDLSQAPTGTATVIASLELSKGPTFNFPMGEVNDVAIMPNGRLGVVNHRNSVHFIHMRTGVIKAAFDLSLQGVPAPGIAVDPTGATDSIAITDTHAAVISTRRHPIGKNEPWIFLFELNPAPPLPAGVPVLRYLSPFVDPDIVGTIEDFTSIARSVRITPDGLQAVMTADYLVASIPTGAVGSFFPPFFLDPADKRFYEDTRDSLEVTNTRAVTLANRTAVGFALKRFRVRPFDISVPGVLTPRQEGDSPVPPGVDDRAHDLAITPDGQTAIVKSVLHNVIVQNLTATSQGYVFGSSNGSPYLLNPVTGSMPSDSVVISGSTPPFTAIAIGTMDNPQLKTSGIVDFISLPTGTLIASVNEFDPSTTNAQDIRAMDLKLNLGGSRLWVRFEHASGAAPGSSLGQSVILYNMTGGLLTRFAASGDTFRLDDIEIGGSAAIGISESNAGPQGHVQLIHF